MIFLLAALHLHGSKPITITVNADRVLHPVSKDLFGIFFEEINCAGDGGIYPELVRNRAFQDADTPEHWSVEGPLEAKVQSGKLLVTANGNGQLVNKGYWGMDLEKGQKYTLQVTGDFTQPTDLTFVAKADSKTIASTPLKFKGGSRETITTAITPSRLRLPVPSEYVQGQKEWSPTRADEYAVRHQAIFCSVSRRMLG